MTHLPSWLKYAGILMLIALVFPLVAACGDDKDDATSTAPAATEVAPVGDATETTEPEATEEATEAPAPATEAATAAASPEATATGSSGSGEMTTVGPFSVDDVFFGIKDEEGEPGGTFIEGSFSDISTLIPILSQDTSSSAFMAHIFQSVVDLDPNTMEPVGLLAESWEYNEDATVFTFHLRDGVTWSDGEPFTADDVKFSYDLYMNPETGSPRVSDFSDKIDSITVEDDLTITFNLKTPYPDFPVDIMVYGIVAEHVWADVAPSAIATDPGATGVDPSRVVGTGPFLFKEWVIEDHATQVRNENYWNGDVLLDEYIWKVVPDQAAGVAQLQTGEIDLFAGIPESSVKDFEGNTNVKLVDYPTLSFTFYALQQNPEKSQLFQDKEVRQALLYALDRQAMLDSIRFGYGEVAVGTMPVLSWAYNPDGIEEKFDYDPEKAAELLDAAGWELGADGVRAKDGQRMSFTMYTNAGNLAREAYLVALQEFWAAVGVEMMPQYEPFPALVERITETFDFEAILIGFSWGVTPDQTTMFSCNSREGNGFNMSYYCNEEVDELLAKALVEPDQAERIKLYTEFQNIVVDEQPVAVMDFPQAFVGVSNRVHNVNPNAVNIRYNVQNWWVEK